MSLYNLARQVQSKGRGDDTMLVHMTPGEVKGLQSLAMAHGGSLSINPETGLPEARFLKNILPSVIGGAVGIATMNPMLGAAVGGGLGMATSGGNLTRGIMSGLGAYGFGSLGAGLASSGAQALAPEAIAGGLGVQGAATGAGSQAAMLAQQNAGFGLEGIESIRNAATGATGFSPATVSPMPSAVDSIQAGFKSISSPSEYFKKNMFPIGAAALGTMAAADAGQQYGIPPAQTGTIKPYTYTQTRNPEFGKVPGAPYFNQTFTAGTPYAAKEGGIVTLASGGMPSGPVERMSMKDMQPGMYPQGMMDKTEYATPTQRPASMEIIKSDYDVGVNPMTGMQNLGMAGGGVVALANGGGKFSDIQEMQVAPNLGRYSQPAPAVNPAVTAYNQILADRAANEYVVQPPPLTMLPGGGERAGLGDTEKLINQYYLSQLGRQGDPEGLQYWAQRKIDTGESLADIKKAIGGSQEGQIFSLYRDVLGRRPDAEGSQYWQSQLAAGVPLADIRKQFEASQEFKAKPATATTTAKPGLGGYTYDPVTGFVKAPTPEPEQQDFTGFMNFANDPAFQNYLRQQYQQSQQSIGGGKAGGLMPTDLKSGGISDLGDYSDGGRLLKGPGDGVSDSIPAQIGARQPARLADGEFVVPARIVSELGNGSTDAGARKLYAMMDRIQKRRKKSVGKDKVAVDSKAESLLPA